MFGTIGIAARAQMLATHVAPVHHAAELIESFIKEPISTALGTTVHAV